MSKQKKLIFIVCILIAFGIIVGVLFFNNSNKYKITFDSNGGSVVTSQLIKKGETVQKPLDPIKEGYLFVEWTYLNDTYDFTYKVTKDMVLKAKWIKQKKDTPTFIVKFNSDGGTTIPNQIIEKGKKVIKPTNPTKEGYIFKDWILNNESYNFDIAVKNDLELKAIWEKAQDNKVQDKKEQNKEAQSNKSTTKQNTNTKHLETQTPSKNPIPEVKLPTPTISEIGFGGGIDGSSGMLLKLNSIEGITGIEIYSAPSVNGNYTLLKKVKKEEWNNDTASVIVQKGQHLYFKVRTYVTNSAGTFYSGYSNVLDVDNTN